MGLIFKKNNNIYINFSNKEENLSTIIIDDFVFIYSNERLVALNIFNTNKFDYLKNGFSTIKKNFIDDLTKFFPDIFQNFKFNNFYMVGKINHILKHPKSEKLIILNLISDKKYQIVTNRIDLKENSKIVFATNNSYLPNGTKITNSKVLGTPSEGMILTYKSLKLKDSDELIEPEIEIGKAFNF